MNDDYFGLELPSMADGGDAGLSGWDYLSRSGHIKCVFSNARVVKMGLSANRRTHKSRNYWFVEQVGKNRFEGRILNNRHVPTGDAEQIDLQDLVSNYTPEITYFEEIALPAMLELEKTLDRGDEHRERGRLDRAREEYERARGIEEMNVKALFGLGLIFLERGEDRQGQGSAGRTAQDQGRVRGQEPAPVQRVRHSAQKEQHVCRGGSVFPAGA